MNTYLEVFFLSSILLAQSLSVYPTNLKSSFAVYKIPNPLVPFTYLRILFLTCQWKSFGVSINLEIRLTTCIRSGQVVVKYIKLPTILLYSVGFTRLVQPSLLNFKPISIGVGATLLFFILNLSKIYLAYFSWEMKIPLCICFTSMPIK